MAREYLAPEVRRTWRPGVGVVVYDDSSGNGALLVQQGPAITLRATEVARISEQGEYTASPGGTVTSAKFTLRKVGGEWRIASLPDGLFLTQLDVARAYRSFDLYFPDPTRDGPGAQPDAAARGVRCVDQPGARAARGAQRLAGPGGRDRVPGGDVADRRALPSGTTSSRWTSAPPRSGPARRT